MSAFCSISPCKEEKDTIVGTSTNCSAVWCFMGAKRNTGRRDDLDILGTLPAKSKALSTATSWSQTAAQVHRGSARRDRSRRRAPRCAAAPSQEAHAARPDRSAATLRCLGQTARSTPLPQPLPPSTCRSWPRHWQFSVPVGRCVVVRLCQSHCDGHPCILQVCTEASLPSPPCGPRASVINRRVNH